MHPISALQQATLAARKRNNGKNISVEIDAGWARVVVVTYDADGMSTSIPLSGWMPPAKVVHYLNAI